MSSRQCAAAWLAAIAVAAAGCGDTEEPPRTTAAPIDTRAGAGCGEGTPRPVDARSLLRVFRTHGIPLERDDACFTPEDLYVASTSDGGVFCRLFAPAAGDTATIERTHYADDEETTLDYLNVQCSVYPSADARAEQEIAQVARAMRALRP